MNKNLFFVLVAVFVLTLGISLVVLEYGDFNKSSDDGKLKLAATIFPVTDIARNIAGNDVEVVQVLPSGASPHDFEPTIKDRAELDDAAVLFVIGNGLDDWATDLVGESTDVVSLDQGVVLRAAEVHEEDEVEVEGEDHDETGVDPHYWLSVENAKIIASNVRDELVSVDPDNKNKYDENLKSYLVELDTLQVSLENKLAVLGVDNRAFITFHDAFGYFASSLDLQIITTVEPYPGQEPSAAYISQVGDILSLEQVNTIFREPQLSDTLVQSLAKDYDAKVYTLDPLGGVEGRGTYIDLMNYNVDTIVEALANENN